MMKCELKPLVKADYFVSFSDGQWSRLQAVFPNGACDYSKPGVGQVAPEPWQTFVDGPGDRPLGAAPVSHLKSSFARVSGGCMVPAGVENSASTGSNSGCVCIR